MPRVQQPIILDVVRALGPSATVAEVREALSDVVSVDGDFLAEQVPRLQQILFGAPASDTQNALTNPHAQRDMRSSTVDARLRVPGDFDVDMDNPVVNTLAEQLARYPGCSVHSTHDGIALELGSFVNVSQCQVLLDELQIRPIRQTDTLGGIVITSNDALALTEHIDTEASAVERINACFAQVYKNGDEQWNVQLKNELPGVYCLAHDFSPNGVRLKAGYSVHSLLRKVESELFRMGNPGAPVPAPTRQWDAGASEHNLRGRQALKSLEKVLNSGDQLKSMLDTTLLSAKLAHSDTLEAAVLEVLPFGLKPVSDLLQKAEADDALVGTSNFQKVCATLGCRPEDAAALQACEGHVILAGTVQLRTDNSYIKDETEECFRALNQHAVNARPKEFLDPSTAAMIEPDRYISNLSTSEVVALDRFLSLMQAPTSDVARTAAEKLEARVTETARWMGNYAQLALPEGFVGGELSSVRDINALKAAVLHDVSSAANDHFVLSDSGLAAGHGMLDNATRLELCYGRLFSNASPNDRSEAERQTRIDTLKQKLTGSPAFARQVQQYPAISQSVQSMFASASSNNHAVADRGNEGAIYYSAGMMSEALRNIETFTARFLQIDAGDTRTTADALERFSIQICGIGDLWAGCAEGLAQKTRPLVAAIEVGNIGSESLEGKIAAETTRVLEDYVKFCRKAQTNTSRSESSMSNVDGAFNHVIGLSQPHDIDSGWYRANFVNDRTCRTVLKANVSVKDLLAALVDEQLAPELANIRSAWEGGSAIQVDWEALLDRLGLSAEEKADFRTSDDYEFQSVPRFNLVEWMLPILALRHLKMTGIIEARSGGVDDQLYANFLEAWRRQGGDVGEPGTPASQDRPAMSPELIREDTPSPPPSPPPPPPPTPAPQTAAPARRAAAPARQPTRRRDPSPPPRPPRRVPSPPYYSGGY